MVLEINVCFTGFVNDITIFTFVSLSVWFYLPLAEDCLLFVLKAIKKNNKIDYNDNSKIIILTTILYRAVQG